MAGKIDVLTTLHPTNGVLYDKAQKPLAYYGNRIDYEIRPSCYRNSRNRITLRVLAVLYSSKTAPLLLFDIRLTTRGHCMATSVCFCGSPSFRLKLAIQNIRGGPW